MKTISPNKKCKVKSRKQKRGESLHGKSWRTYNELMEVSFWKRKGREEREEGQKRNK